MNKKETPAITLIAMFMVTFFVVFLAVKQFLVLRESVYLEAYYGTGEK